MVSRISGVSGAFLSNRPGLQLYGFGTVLLDAIFSQSKRFGYFSYCYDNMAVRHSKVKDLFWLTVSTCLSREDLAGTPHTLMSHMQSALAEGKEVAFKACPWWWASTSYVPCPQGPTSWGLNI